jgi:hypothetical protein
VSGHGRALHIASGQLGHREFLERAIMRFGDIVAHPILGGLHHRDMHESNFSEATPNADIWRDVGWNPGSALPKGSRDEETVTSLMAD